MPCPSEDTSRLFCLCKVPQCRTPHPSLAGLVSSPCFHGQTSFTRVNTDIGCVASPAGEVCPSESCIRPHCTASSEIETARNKQRLNAVVKKVAGFVGLVVVVIVVVLPLFLLLSLFLVMLIIFWGASLPTKCTAGCF